MDITTLGTVVGIVAICYVIGLGCKAYEKIPDKWIPVIMAVCGGALGVAGLYTMPDFPAGDVVNAIAGWQRPEEISCINSSVSRGRVIVLLLFMCDVAQEGE